MAKWHETLAGRLGLRIGGLLPLGAAWLMGTYLYRSVHAEALHDASLAELGECTLMLLCLLVGCLLLFVGAGLWQRVEVPGRWTGALVEPRTFEIFETDEKI